jgi:phage-related protein
LRCQGGKVGYRILYRRSRNLLILLHVIIKDGRKVPRRDFVLAQRRWENFKVKMDTPDRRGPRPIGKDAP